MVLFLSEKIRLGTSAVFKILTIFLFCTSFVNATFLESLNQAEKLDLSQQRYWHLLLHMVEGESEIDDEQFFIAHDGKNNPKHELDSTLYALYHESVFDDNSTACRFPARKAWLEEQLNIHDLPQVLCKEYDAILQRINPKSATFVFPSAHINSPASMFGHTFLRINSAYKSKLLSYAINYAADANPDDTNAVAFALNGLFGGYFGSYSLLPYYDKLKEYRDTENRDIWEYDLNLTEAEVLKMFRHIWELNGTHSTYYFFTENCSYNMLWLLELARPSVHLREHFHFEVIPLESIHAAKIEGILDTTHYRASKRSILLQYETLIEEKYIHLPRSLVDAQLQLKDVLEDANISLQQKRYILEASTELLEYSFSKNTMQKEKYLELFYDFTQQRATLGEGEKLSRQTPPNPIDSHRAIRATAGFGVREADTIGFLGIRPAYHDLQDSSYGFLRGTQIEFLNLDLSYSKDALKVEKATLISIASLAQRTEFFKNFSWRTHFGFDTNYLNTNANFLATLGAGYTFGNKSAYLYALAEPLFYVEQSGVSGLGGSVGFVVDRYNFMSTNIEATQRFYDTGKEQYLLHASQNFRLAQNFQLKFDYDYREKYDQEKRQSETTLKSALSYYF